MCCKGIILWQKSACALCAVTCFLSSKPGRAGRSSPCTWTRGCRRWDDCRYSQLPRTWFLQEHCVHSRTSSGRHCLHYRCRGEIRVEECRRAHRSVSPWPWRNSHNHQKRDEISGVHVALLFRWSSAFCIRASRSQLFLPVGFRQKEMKADIFYSWQIDKEIIPNWNKYKALAIMREKSLDSLYI